MAKNIPASATTSGLPVSSLRKDTTRHTQTVRAKVVAVCKATRVNNGFHQQITVEFFHVAGHVHSGSRRTVRYSMRETLAVNITRAPLVCGQYIELTYTYRVDSRMQPHSIKWQETPVV